MKTSGDIIALPGFELDLAQSLLRDSAGTEVRLRPQAMAVLQFLARNAGRVVTKDELMQSVWAGTVVTDDSLVQCVKEIRQALQDHEHRIVRTSPKRGYWMVLPTGIATGTNGAIADGTTAAGLVGNVAVPPAQASSRRRFGVGAVALALGGAGGATGLWWWLSGAAATRILPRAEQPSIVVLPIRNISGGERWDRLARGLTEDVTTDLARNHWLFIIASSAAFQRAASGKDSLTIARELGVRFVLEGSLQAEGDALRVNARLLEAAGGSSVWSQRWNKPAGQLFDIQDSIVEAIDSALGSAWTGAIAASDRENARRRPTNNLAAYELYLLGTELKHRFTPAAVEKGVEHLKQAVQLDPGFTKAWVSLAIAHFNLQMFARDAQKRDQEMAARLAAIKQAFRSDPNDPEALIQHSVLMALEGNTPAAQRALRSATAAAPNNADVLAVAAAAGSTRCPLGDEPLDWAQRAQRLNPNPPNWYFIGLGKSALYTRRFELAIDSLAKAPDIPVRWWNAAAAHALHGELDAARRTVSRLMELVPGASATKILADRSEWGDEAARALFLKGALLAGMPE